MLFYMARDVKGKMSAFKWINEKNGRVEYEISEIV